jgi:hypothetical protein
MNAAAMARQSKERRPADFCGEPHCLWRVKSRTGAATPCPKHPVAALPTAPFPGYDVRAMTYHGGSVDAEQRVDDRHHIANDREEVRELAERWEEGE